MDDFSDEERDRLSRHFSNTDEPVFVLTDLPEMVKGALFARYSRSPKTLRRLFLDEFQDGVDAPDKTGAVGLDRATALYERVFLEYGDDSVAQLAGVHLAVEGASNILTKVIERGRLMSYLEQSTRYMPYNDRPGGRWRYHVPDELTGDVRDCFVATADRAFELYTALFEPLTDYLKTQFPQPEGSSNAAYRMSIRAKVCDILRGLLPAATTSNVGIYGSAQGYEALLLRLRSHELAEARSLGESMLRELKKVVPVFVERVERPDRGGVFVDYLQRVRDETRRLLPLSPPSHLRTEAPDATRVRLTEYDPEGELSVLAAILFELGDLSDEAALAAARNLSPDERGVVIEAYAGPRSNRRHHPGRAFERTSYRFEVVADYGAFRDLQRHRLLTIEWQQLTPYLGYDMPPEIVAIGAEPEWRSLMDAAASAYETLRSASTPAVAQYVVPMAYRIRFIMDMNAREAMHVIELRTSEQAHPNYRRVCLEMHRLIREQAGHRLIAEAMRFVGTSESGLERLNAEQRIEARRSALAARDTSA